MRSAALLLGVLLLCVGPRIGRAAEVPVTPDPADLPGIYECQGTGADGRPYRGAVIIEPDGSRFVVRWIIASELTAVGVGIREGNMLAVSFFGPESGGVVLYRIDGQQLDRSLERAACRGPGVRGDTDSRGKPAGAVVNHSTASAASTAVRYAVRSDRRVRSRSDGSGGTKLCRKTATQPHRP